MSSIICSSCSQPIDFFLIPKAKFCPYCAAAIVTSSQSLISHRYKIEKEIGKGGMGEVFLAFDTKCSRPIALKRIRSDLKKHPRIIQRFLKEAHITCQLTHPGIIPIYSIQKTKTSAYYTMPFIEGETLKQIIRRTRLQEKKGDKMDALGGSIPALMRIFLNVCQAVSYAHSKGILHRDLKLENIIVGKFGEVLILDWGLATFTYSPQNTENVQQPESGEAETPGITRIGKVVGTITYMAPERCLGAPATIQTDVYSLGVILYQLLSLHSPFKRGTLKEFRKTVHQEEWTDPVQVAPYRDIPRILAKITEECLKKNPLERCSSVEIIISYIKNYLEGRSDWIEVVQLNINRKADWEFQEHVLIAEHAAITRATEESEWVHLMISDQSFTGNTRIELEICLGEESRGIGILFSVPEASQRKTVYDGYCLRIGSEHNRNTRLMQSNIELLHAPDVFLKTNTLTHLTIEKIDKTIYVYLNQVLQLSYIAHIPLMGTHIGFLSSDRDFTITPLKISLGNLNLNVNCLAVPDAFLARRDFSQALSEYRRIAYSFSDRPEGREALFRAGLTLLEEAKDSSLREELLDQALHEFEKLHGTPGGPLEYLGKALVYQSLNETEEEIKCYELAYRRYQNHPLLSILQEHILSRMNDVSRKERVNAYRFILLAARHFSATEIDKHSKRLLISLNKHWEPLFFIQENVNSSSLDKTHLVIGLAFWLAQPYILEEIADQIKDKITDWHIYYENILFSFMELDEWEHVKACIERDEKKYASLIDWHSLHFALKIKNQGFEEEIPYFRNLLKQPISFQNLRSLLFLLDELLQQERYDLLHAVTDSLDFTLFSFEICLKIHVRMIWMLLMEKNWKKAGELLYSYPIEWLNKGSTFLHFLYGCWLQATEGQEMAILHFKGLLPVPYPRSWNLAAHYLTGELAHQGWEEQAFYWEKKELYKSLVLFYHCSEEEEKKEQFMNYLKL